MLGANYARILTAIDSRSRPWRKVSDPRSIVDDKELYTREALEQARIASVAT